MACFCKRDTNTRGPDRTYENVCFTSLESIHWILSVGLVTIASQSNHCFTHRFQAFFNALDNIFVVSHNYNLVLQVHQVIHYIVYFSQSHFMPNLRHFLKRHLFKAGFFNRVRQSIKLFG